MYLLASRFSKPIGFTANIPFISNEMYDMFVKNANPGVIFFIDQKSKIDFADFGVSRYMNEINFARGGFVEAERDFNCTNYPCIVPIRKGKRIPLRRAPQDPIAFANWLSYVMDPHTITIRSPEHLRLIIEGKQHAIFAVDYDKRPKEAPTDELVCLCNSTFFEELSMEVKKGVYVFRAADRELVPLTKRSQFQTVVQSSIISLDDDDIYSKPYLFGYWADDSSNIDTQLEIQILKKIAPDYKDKSMITLARDGKIGDAVRREAHMETIPNPFFFAIRTENTAAGRWLITDKTLMHNVTYVRTLLDNIFADKEPFSLFSEPDPQEDSTVFFHKLTGNTFKKQVFDNNNDVVVMLSAPWCTHCKNFKPTINVTAKLLKDNEYLKFFWMDGSLNDVDESIADFSGYPSLYLFADGKKDSPLLFEGQRTVEGLLEFLQPNVTHALNVPQYDSDALDEEIRNLRHPKKATPVPTPEPELTPEPSSEPEPVAGDDNL